MSFSIIGSDDCKEEYGGKAFGLFLLNSVGLPIPETLIIPYDLNDVTPYQDKIEDFVNQIINKNANAKFAIRSSASNEDGVDNSWAGIYDTKLSVEPVDVFETILKMFHYVDTNRKDAYSTFAKNTSDTNMSLVVQRMVNPNVSGVCFTINPITGNNKETVIEVVSGLGEKLVGGLVTPQMYIISDSGECTQYEAGDYSEQKLLSDYIIKEFIEKVLYIKRTLYQKADIEFAFYDNQIFFLQIRPVTKVYNTAV